MDTSHRRNFIVKGLLALAGGLLGRKALAADEKPAEDGPLTTEGQVLKSSVYKNRPPIEPLDTMIRFERSDETTGTVGTQEILSLMHEQKGNGTSYPWTIYSHLTTHHTGGDACVLCSRLTKNGPGWSCGLHSEVFNHARAVALGMNIEMTNYYTGPDKTLMIGMNIQMLKGEPMQYGIQVHGEGHTEKGIGLNGVGDTGLDVAGKYGTGIHMHGHEIALDSDGKVRVRYKDGRIEFLNGDKLIGHIDAAGEDTVIIYGINDTPEPWTGEVRCGLFRLDGGSVGGDSSPRPVTLPPNASTVIGEIPMEQWTALGLDTSGAFALLLQDGVTIAQNRVFVTRFKDLEFAEPQIKVERRGDRAVFTSPTFVWAVTLDPDGESPVADDVFDLLPGIPYEIPWPEDKPLPTVERCASTIPM